MPRLRSGRRFRRPQSTVGKAAPVAAVALGGVQGFVGAAVEIVERITCMRQHNADADRDAAVRSRILMALYRSPQPVALPQHDVRRADAVEVHHELVAAQTPHHVADAEVLSQDAGDIGQHEIAHEMTVRIVHVFEAIDVHDQQGAPLE